MRKKYCKECNQLFEYKRNTKKFCSSKCRDTHNGKLEKKKEYMREYMREKRKQEEESKIKELAEKERLRRRM